NGFHEAINGVSRKWTPALGLKDERTRRIALQLAQHAQFIAADGMHGGLAALRPADVQCRIAAPFNLRPLEIGDLDGPQAVPESNQDQRSVSLAVAAAAISFSTSAGVRYSRVRISAFGFRVGTFR